MKNQAITFGETTIGIDANGNVVNNNEGVNTVYGSMDSRLSFTYDLKAGTYKVVSPDHAEFDRGVRLYEITIDLGGEDNPGEDNPGGDNPGEENPPVENPPVENPPVDDTPNEEPEEELNFFQRIFKAIADFFKKLFSIFKKK